MWADLIATAWLRRAELLGDAGSDRLDAIPAPPAPSQAALAQSGEHDATGFGHTLAPLTAKAPDS
jgi:hypothetical protein